MSTNHRTLLFFVTGLVWSAISWANPTPVVLGSVSVEANRNLLMGRPIPTDNSTPELLVSRPTYALSWNVARRVPNWVAWEIRKGDLQGANPRSHFVTDPDLKVYLGKGPTGAVSPSEYTNTCFDRGHQAAAADRKASIDDNRSTFYMSNVMPQTPWLNRIEWRNLEYFERKVVTLHNKRLMVVSGGIFAQNPSTIGPRRNIAVPSHNFKVILAIEEGQSLADVTMDTPMLVLKFPNVNSDGSDPQTNLEQTCEDHSSHYDRPPETWPATDDWTHYQTSLAEVEDLTGFQFFRSVKWIDGFKAWSLPKF